MPYSIHCYQCGTFSPEQTNTNFPIPGYCMYYTVTHLFWCPMSPYTLALVPSSPVESKHPAKHHQAQWLLAEVLSRRRRYLVGQPRPPFRLGVSGPPGAGKSSFIERLGLLLTSRGLWVAVLVSTSVPLSLSLSLSPTLVLSTLSPPFLIFLLSFRATKFAYVL